MHKYVGILFVLLSASASVFAGSSKEDVAKLVKMAGTVEQARNLIKECGERAVVSSETLQVAISGKDDLAKYTLAVIETTCISEILHMSKKK